MKKLLFLLLLTVLSDQLDAQTYTLTLKPGPDSGEDVTTWMLDGNCIPNNYTATPAELSSGNGPLLIATDWTWYISNCYSGTIRSLLRFTGLSAIPSNATIISATLKLYGVDNPGWASNSYYSGSPYFLPNTSWLRKVTGPWNENSVTWNTMPGYTIDNQIPIDSTDVPWNWNFNTSSANLVTMVQSWVTNPSTNYGFMFMLNTEEYYRRVVFASSDNENPALWPELIVEYEIPFDSNSIEIPNVITANKDGINDVFTVDYKNVTFLSYTITNRWGNLLKEGQLTVPPSSVFNWNSTPLWDATTNAGENVADGTYYYRIVFETYNGLMIEKSGFLQVVR